MDIKFTYSFQHDSRLSRGGTRELISREKIDENKKLMDIYWTDQGHVLEETLKDITGLSFIKPEITCYLTSYDTYSDPLSLKVEGLKDMTDNLVHELCHVLLTQNNYALTDRWRAFIEHFKDEKFLTQVHIAIFAMHTMFAQRLNPERLPFIRTYSKDPDYIRAWELLDKYGVDNILQTIFGK